MMTSFQKIFIAQLDAYQGGSSIGKGVTSVGTLKVALSQLNAEGYADDISDDELVALALENNVHYVDLYETIQSVSGAGINKDTFLDELEQKQHLSYQGDCMSIAYSTVSMEDALTEMVTRYFKD